MSLRRETACDFGPCPYADMHSGYMNSCEYWCGAEEPQDEEAFWDDIDDQIDVEDLLEDIKKSEYDLEQLGYFYPELNYREESE